MSIEHLYLVSLSRGILDISNWIGDFKYEIIDVHQAWG
jgi:hypothetical protein